MYIQSFHIDNFGVFSHVDVEALSPGLTVFLGRNEAGKSTCLEFLRTMLTGYPHARSKEAQERNYAQLLPGRTGQAGGSLRVHLEERGLVHITRRPQKGRDSVVLTDAAGQVLEGTLLESILSGVTREVYRNVFGFSLTELQVFESLKDEGVRHALYGASFGMGLRSPGEVLKELNQKMEKLYKMKGSAPFINEALRNLDRVQKEIASIKKQCATYDNLSQQHSILEEELQNIRHTKAQWEQERRDAERQLGVWKQWEQWRLVENQLLRLVPVPETFPEDGAGRLERAQLLRQEAARRMHTEQERYNKLEEKFHALTLDENLLERKALLQSLHEHKSSFRQAQEGLISHMGHIQRTQNILNQHLADLGPHWTCARIHSTNRSLVARSTLERKVAHIQATEQAHVAATSHLEKSNGAVTNARHQVELAQKTLEHLPEPQAPANKEERESIRQQKATLENATQGMTEKEAHLLTTQRTFQRTLAPLSLRPLSEHNATKYPVKDVLPQLQALRQCQEEALALASTAQELRKNTFMAEQAMGQAQEKEDISKARLERLKQYLRCSEASSRERIDIRARAIRTLRHMHTMLSLEKERIAEIKERIATSTPPEPVKSIVLIILGSIIIACGLIGLALPIYFAMDALQVTENLIIPLSQWTCYLVVLTGAGFLAGGLPRSGPDRKKFAQEMQSLTNKAAQMEQALQDMEGQIQEQCVLAEVKDADPITLDAVEILLEREREKCATEDRIRLDLEQLEIEHQEVYEFSLQKRQEVTSAQQQEQQALLRWHECLRGHDVQNIPSPDAAATFFARVEAALVAQEAAQNLEEDMALLLQSKEESAQKLCAIPAIQQALQDMDAKASLSQEGTATIVTEESHGHESLAALLPVQGDIDYTTFSEQEILQAVHVVLEACREADEALAQRAKADAVLHTATHNLETALQEQVQSVQNLQNNEQEMQDAGHALSDALREMGLDKDISPTMLRSVLECMEKCLSVEAEILRLQEEKDRMEKECAHLVHPLRSLLEELQLPLPEVAPSSCTGENFVPYQEDWLQSLDNILLQLHNAQEAQLAKAQLQEQLHTQEEELHEASTALNDAEFTIMHLLKLGQTEQAEDFFRLARVRAEYQELEKRKHDLEDALRLAAGDKELEAFLQSFATKEQHQCELFLHRKEEELQGLVAQEQEKMHDFATLSATLQGLTSTDTLAALRQEEKDIQESVQDAAASWAKFAVARQLLLQAKQRFEQERQPQVIRMASDIFAAITQEKWKGLTASLEDSHLQVISPFGEPLSPHVLSRGTQEQLYLALRLAYIRNHAAHAKALPVIMDDVLVNFDPERAERTGTALVDLTESGKKHQVLFFTCHPHMADMLQKDRPESKRFLVENHTIREDRG